MPIYEIETPSGRVLEIEANDEATAMRGAQEWSSQQKPRTSQGLGFAQGFFKPIDNAAAAVEAGLDAIGVPTEAIGEALGGTAADVNAQRQAAFQAAEAQGVRPGAVGSVAGNFASTIPMVAAAGLGTAPIAGGAAIGALNTDATDLAGVAQDAAIGAALGKVGDKVFGAAAEFAAPALKGAVKSLADRGVRMTPGQRFGGVTQWLEDRASSLPVAGPAIDRARQRALSDFNVGAVDEALSPLGLRVPAGVEAGHEAVRFADDAISAAYKASVPRLRVVPDARFAVSLREAGKKMSLLPESARKRFDEILQATIQTDADGTLTGQSFQAAQSGLGTIVSTLAKSQDPWDKLMGRAVGDVLDGLKDAATRQNPGSKFSAANAAFAGMVPVKNAARMADGGVATPAQLKTGVRSADRSVRKGKTARGEARMQGYAEAGKERLSSKVGNSGTTDRANLLSLPAWALGVPALGAFQAGQLATGLLSRQAGPTGQAVRKAIERARPLGLLGGLALTQQ